MVVGGPAGEQAEIDAHPAYTTFLKRREGQGDLIAALQRAGHGLEAELLMDWTGSGVRATETSDGRRAWVGPVLPAAPHPGDLWLDVAELMPMLYVMRRLPGAARVDRAAAGRAVAVRGLPGGGHAARRRAARSAASAP